MAPPEEATAEELAQREQIKKTAQKLSEAKFAAQTQARGARGKGQSQTSIGKGKGATESQSQPY